MRRDWADRLIERGFARHEPPEGWLPREERVSWSAVIVILLLAFAVWLALLLVIEAALARWVLAPVFLLAVIVVMSWRAEYERRARARRNTIDRRVT